VFCVGYSLGAGILLNYLGTVGAASPLTGAVAVSPSWDFTQETSVFDWWSRGHLVQGLKKYLRMHREYLEGHADCRINIPGALSCASVREFDLHAVVPVHGYDDVDHYYRESSACRRAHNIRVPTLAVSADDDPVCNVAGCPAEAQGGSFGPGLVVARTSVGGHVAFADGLLVTTSSWQDKVSVDWCNACLKVPTRHT
jgi:predicted alpha/beta-fold hydrolase